MTKNEARNLALKSRKNKDVSKISDLVIKKIIKSNIIAEYSNIGIYYPIDKEIDITNLKILYPDKKFYLPITKEGLIFAEYLEPLFKGPFKTMEPRSNIINRDSIDCFIIPCVAITSDMKRIGYGKGYYDRYLEDYDGLKIGICYEDSVFNDLLGDSHDIVLDEIFVG
ncbi:MAG: 5-formyltetrahydrofolate cyclo-ligase [Anaeroplasma sp.]